MSAVLSGHIDNAMVACINDVPDPSCANLRVEDVRHLWVYLINPSLTLSVSTPSLSIQVRTVKMVGLAGLLSVFPLATVTLARHLNYEPPEIKQDVDQMVAEFQKYVNFKGPDHDVEYKPEKEKEKPESAVISGFWMEQIRHQGKAPFNPQAGSYRVFRNVKDFGAMGKHRMALASQNRPNTNGFQVMVSLTTRPPLTAPSAVVIDVRQEVVHRRPRPLLLCTFPLVPIESLPPSSTITSLKSSETPTALLSSRLMPTSVVDLVSSTLTHTSRPVTLALALPTCSTDK